MYRPLAVDRLEPGGKAARLLGAADSFVESIGGFFDPVLPDEHERAIATVRAALAHTAGAALSLEEAVTEALAVADEAGGTIA